MKPPAFSASPRKRKGRVHNIGVDAMIFFKSEKEVFEMRNGEEKCEHCEFYNYGSCVRFPPKIFQTIIGTESGWPEVSKWDWCGEFKANPAEKRFLENKGGSNV